MTTLQKKLSFRDTRHVEMDCERLIIISNGMHGRLERDLSGHLFHVIYGGEGGRRVGYSEALDFITEHSAWKHPWKVLTIHGIPPLAARARARQRRAAAA